MAPSIGDLERQGADSAEIDGRPVKAARVAEKEVVEVEETTEISGGKVVVQKGLGPRTAGTGYRGPHLAGGMAEYARMYRASVADPRGFFGEAAVRGLSWVREFEHVHGGGVSAGAGADAAGTGGPGFGSNCWFVNGQLNACYNCVDRHALREPGRRALIFEPDEPGGGRGRVWTYGQLLEQVCRVAQVLERSMGVRRGDTVAIYMPMVAEAVVAVLAAARIGAVHSVVFAGFSANSVRERVMDGGTKFVVCMDESVRGGKVIRSGAIVEEALRGVGQVEAVLVCRRAEDGSGEDGGGDGGGGGGDGGYRRLDWHTEARKYKPYCPCVPVDSEHPLFVLYTSGSTGKPKGIEHSTAGYLLGALLSTKYTFDVHQEDIFFTAGDVGWITGHTYALYGPLLNGCTTVIFEGTPSYPSMSRYWDIIDKHNVTQFYVAPTALRLLKRAGDSFVDSYNLTSLRALGSVGEPIAPDVWEWFSSKIGKNDIPICDTYWQTESGSHLITTLAGGVTPMKPGSAGLPFFGIEPCILNPTTGEELPDGEEGVLAIKKPWPSMARSIWNNHERFVDTYLKPYENYYFTGDGAVRDKDGYIWILGRVDDVVNVSGHRLSTAEIESALIHDPIVAECAVVGFNDELTGQAVAAFIVLKSNKLPVVSTTMDDLTEIKKHLILTVRKDIGPFASPKLIVLVDDLPKTRSGKIMRRILRKILAGESDQLGDISTLSNPDVVQHLIESVTL